ncbi:hypothetical protein [Hoeflea sp.]|uniref:hypothetical protein n=1 Tax=Hoeflea sp. TaxID=1940281 RepID=UPI0025BDF722|nr:hypothetical protein [Hoeflea sp.]
MTISRRSLLAGLSTGILASQFPALSLAASGEGFFDLVAVPSKQRLYTPARPPPISGPTMVPRRGQRCA